MPTILERVYFISALNFCLVGKSITTKPINEPANTAAQKGKSIYPIL